MTKLFSLVMLALFIAFVVIAAPVMGEAIDRNAKGQDDMILQHKLDLKYGD